MPEEIEKNMRHYFERIMPILIEAQSYGISSVLIMHENNPISGESGFDFKVRGEPFLIRGMIDYVHSKRGPWPQGS